jgi:hypothetical protein
MRQASGLIVISHQQPVVQMAILVLFGRAHPLRRERQYLFLTRLSQLVCSASPEFLSDAAP